MNINTDNNGKNTEDNTMRPIHFKQGINING